MGNFDKKQLEGSFRLPYRISECIKGVSERINDKRSSVDSSDIINPFKGSPPGARPIVVYATGIKEAKGKLIDIINTYRGYGIDNATIFEKDRIISEILIEGGIKANEETILKAKGMEKPCVIWSTRVSVDSDNEVFEYVYTILTRTSAILIIVISEKTLPIYINILKVLNNDRLIFYDQASEAKYYQLIEVVEKKEIDDVDDTRESEDEDSENEQLLY